MRHLHARATDSRRSLTQTSAADDRGMHSHWRDGPPMNQHPLMFEKILIANRGAIACRILRTLRELQVTGVAVYAEADRASRHVSEAPIAHGLGDGPAAATYLDVQKILEIARRENVQAIHPGYGFLSENASFGEACEAAGIAFIGPTPAQLRAFGL